VQPGDRVIWLTHERIPGLMEGMTMAFEAVNRETLRSLTPGDSVQCTRAVQDGRLQIVAIHKE
jgi:Cu/Ag efflux protein CusF